MHEWNRILRDGIYFLINNLKSIVICMIIAGLLSGCFGYVKGRHQVDNYYIALEEYKLEEIEYNAELEQFNKDVLMVKSYSLFPRSGENIYIESSNQPVLEGTLIAQICSGYGSKSEFLPSELMERYPEKELVKDIYITYDVNLPTLNIYLNSTEDSEESKAILDLASNQYVELWSEQYPDYEFKLTNSNSYEKTFSDSELVNQKELELNKPTQPVYPLSISIQSIYLLVGMVIGVCLAILRLLVKIFVSPVVMSKEEFENMYELINDIEVI